MKTMRTISMPGARRWVVLGLVVAILAVLLAVASLIALAGHGSTALAAPEPQVQATGAVHVVKSGAGHLVRGYRVPWEYGPGPLVGPRQIEVHAPVGRRWLVVLVVLIFIALAAALAVALAWILLRRRARGAHPGGAQEILERRLAEGSIDVDEFEKRREALRGSAPQAK